MKEGYKRVLFFQIAMFIIFILNSFVSNILRGYSFIIFLVLCLIFFKIFMGFEKDRNRYTKDIIFEMIMFLTIYFILFYLFGVIISFAKTANYYTWYGIKTFIIPLILTVILKEILRYMMLKKSEGNKLLLITTVIIFIFLDVTDSIYYNSFESSYDTFLFIALSLLPAISSNIFCTYLTKKVGYKPVILYLLVTRLYAYLLPIIPNPNEYITAIINFLLPVTLGYRIHLFLSKFKDEHIDRKYKNVNFFKLGIPVFMTIVIVYFTSGYFKYYSLAIASGSMTGTINKGDVAIVKKIDGDYDNLDKGDIIAFQHNKVVVVHRIVDILREGDVYYFYTKGDANKARDNYAVEQSMVIGTVDIRIPYVGYPTVWLNEM